MARQKTKPNVKSTAGSRSFDRDLRIGMQDDLQPNPRIALLDVIDDARVGLLDLSGGGDGMQPMTHFPNADAGVIWFISSIETDLVKSIGLGQDAQYVVISTDHDAHVSLRGKRHQVNDSARLDAHRP